MQHGEVRSPAGIADYNLAVEHCRSCRLVAQQLRDRREWDPSWASQGVCAQRWLSRVVEDLGLGQVPAASARVDMRPEKLALLDDARHPLSHRT